MKTAVSLDEELFERINTLADRMKVSRSRIYTLALREYLKKQEDLVMLERLNAVYGSEPDTEELAAAQAKTSRHRSVVAREPW